MAASNFVLSAKRKMRQGDVAYNRINSENVQNKISASINGLIDSSFYTLDFTLDGYFAANNIFRAGAYRIHKAVDISYYQLGLFEAGNSGSSGVNCVVRDDTGAVLGNLFGAGANRLLINAGAGNDIQIGRDITAGTAFNINTASVTFQQGVLNYTALQAGWSLSPFVELAANRARGMRFVIRLREQ